MWGPPHVPLPAPPVYPAASMQSLAGAAEASARARHAAMAAAVQQQQQHTAAAANPSMAAAPSQLGSLAASCKAQVMHMAEAGLPSESQMEATAHAKAAEMGDPEIAQLLMAWYYCGWLKGQQETAPTGSAAAGAPRASGKPG